MPRGDATEVMHKAELKHRVDRLENLPTLPHVAVRGIAALFGPGRDLDAAKSLFEGDVAFGGHVLHLANSKCGPGDAPVRALRPAMDRVELGGLRSAALGVGIACLAVGDGFDFAPVAKTLRHSLACAICARKLAEQTKDVKTEDAYAAGLLHDVGRLALLSLLPGEYSEVLAQAEAEGAATERVERRELGVDHALVGKWLADRWGLPRPLIQTIWFHHLPPGSLVGKRHAAQLVETVNVANTLSHLIAGDYGDNDAAVLDAAAQAARFGLDEGDLAGLSGDVAEALRQWDAADEGPHNEAGALLALQEAACRLLQSSASGVEDARTLRGHVRRLQALNELNTSLRPGQSQEEVLGLIEKAIRVGLQAAPGMCCALDAEKRFLVGRTWEGLNDPYQEMRIELCGGDTLDATEAMALHALEQLDLGMRGGQWAGSVLRAIVRRGDLMAVPMLADGVSHGQILFSVEHPEVALSEGEYVQLMSFAGACGAALARQRAYEELNGLSEELATALSQSDQVEREQAAEAQASSAGEVAAGAAQALNHPLTVITGQAKSLLDRAVDPVDIQGLSAIVEQGRNVEHIMRDLMAFARPGPPQLEPTMMTFVLHRLVTTVQERFEEKGIRIVEEYEQGLPRVLADRHQMEHVFENLLLNAEEAMAVTGGRVTLRAAATADRGRVTIEVSDTGPGISSGRAQSIFEPFCTMKSDAGSPGLGLSVCRALVESHGGTIELIPSDGGAVFGVALLTAAGPRPTSVEKDLPVAARRTPVRQEVAQAAAKLEAEPKPVPEAEVHLPSILLVDENETVRDVLRETLLNRGYDVSTVDDAADVCEAVSCTDFDVVLLDFQLARVDGLSVLSALHEMRASLPVIVMTASLSDDEADEAARLGARSCLHKPFGLRSLLAEVEQVVGTGSN